MHRQAIAALAETAHRKEDATIGVEGSLAAISHNFLADRIGAAHFPV